MNLYLLKHALAAVAVAASFGAVAQDAAKPAAAEKPMTMQDCRDHMATAKGEKRNDAPPTAETDKACAEMPTKSAKTMKHKSATRQTGVTQEQPTK